MCHFSSMNTDAKILITVVANSSKNMSSYKAQHNQGLSHKYKGDLTLQNVTRYMNRLGNKVIWLSK